MSQTISGHTAITTSASPLLAARKVPGRPITLRCRRAYLPLFLRLAVLLDQVEPLKVNNTWSYNYRAPRMGSSTSISDHAGYAIDCWSNGIGTHTWPSRMPGDFARKISAILETFKTADGRHVFGWGATNSGVGVVYTGPLYTKHASNDPMHFYIAPGITVKDALAVRKAKRIKLDGTIKR